jgi:CheY-like chemotaxis protein
LAISRKLAELQDGSLTAESPGAGRGASFTLTLPLAEEAPRVPTVKLEKQKARCIRVLIIEDNKDAADTMGELIGLLGSDVDVAYDGQSALARARATPPELIICDLGLPRAMDGYAVARALRAEPRLHRTRLIAVSGYSQPEHHAKAKQAGFDRLVPKPITSEVLEALLNEYGYG